jgi:hypothetical protein
MKRRDAKACAGRGAWWHLAVLWLLALGILGMHTLGHASGHGMDGMDDMRRGVAVSAVHVADGQATHTPAPGHGFDPTAMCVAVLGSLLLAVALRVLLGSRRLAATPWLAAAALVIPRPEPPPHAPNLVRLSVLRI